MRPVLVSTYEGGGGAGRAALRLHEGLRGAGIASRLLVQSTGLVAPDVLATRTPMGRFWGLTRPVLDKLPTLVYPRRTAATYSPAVVPGTFLWRLHAAEADVVNLHWIAGGFVRIEDLVRIGKPIVWTLHDMWAFTGGCHYDEECGRYTAQCGRCPQLGSRWERDLSRWGWRRKRRIWDRTPFVVVSPSRWLADRAAESSLMAGRRIEVIPNGLDLKHFRSLPRELARESLHLPAERDVILFGAVSATSDTRKGFAHLRQAVARLARDPHTRDALLVVFGAVPPKHETLEMEVRYLGRLNDDLSLPIVYSAADVMCVPSTTESFGQTAMEAAACGVPVVGFATSGLLDIVDHQRTGYLATPFDAEDFAAGIQWILGDDGRRRFLSEAARKTAEQNFDIRSVAARYVALYEDVLATGHHHG